MSDYDLSLTGAQIDAALSKVHNADTTPTNGSQNMITSDAVHDSLSGYLPDSNVVTNLNSPDNTTVPTTQATKSYVDANSGGSFASGWTDLSSNQNSASGTASSDGFLIFTAKAGDDESDMEITAVVEGVTLYNRNSRYNTYEQIVVPIASGGSWSVTFSETYLERVKFKAFT